MYARRKARALTRAALLALLTLASTGYAAAQLPDTQSEPQRKQQRGFSPSSSRTPAAYVRYFPNGSEEIPGADEDEALANAFAKLGEEDWELTGVRTDLSLNDGNGTTSAVYFFKRPKRQE